ncbi:hypothetical protein EGH21_19560 [Halomicroarcula sp. F13]|uniref:Uncharacterized protein n=1 Tax=Haloarcula rubra TaxID=2487747 RepID=A0AAW4PY67_9EURY|nr:hypothetical protein [Halomicroarcula rubra]MBX0325227.1 hypothetical protein [Halomicroarcula rubra]
MTKAGSLSLSDIEGTLQDIADDDLSAFERRRSGVYYYDPFETREGSRVSDELKSIFTYDLVVNTQTIESRFDIAPTDVDFFTDELEGEDYVRRIAAGERDYYVSGPRLKDETSGDASVDSRLQEEAKHGTISHTDLENVVDVAATSDVIRFLEKNDFIADLDGEYVVKSAMDEYAAHLANEVGESAVDELGDVGVLPLSEFEQILRNEIDELFDVLPHLDRQDSEDLVAAVRDEVATRHDLEVSRELVVDPARFDDYVARRAEQIRDDIESENELATPSDYRDHGHPEIETIEISDATRVNQHVRGAITDQFDTLVDQRFSAESDA